MESRKNNLLNTSFFQSITTFFSSRVLWAGGLLLIGVLTARILGPSDRGLYAMFFTIVGIGTNLSNLGLSQANVYYLNKEKTDIGFLFANTFIVYGVLFVIYITIFLVICNYYNFGFYEHFLLIAIGLSLIEVGVSGFIYGQHLYRAQSYLLILQSAILILTTLLIIPLGVSLYMALLLRLLGMLLFAAIYMGAFFCLTPRMEVLPSLKVMFKQFKYGVRNWIQNLIGLVNYRVYMFVLGYFSGSEAIGFFSVALLFVELIRFWPETIATLLFPKMTSLSSNTKSANYMAISTRLTLLIMLAGALVLIAIVPWLLPLVFGAEYSQAETSCQILLLASVFGVLYQMLTRYFSSENQQQCSIYTGLGALVVAISSSALLIPNFGLTGASLAYLLCNMFSGALMVYFFIKQTKISAVELLIVKRSDFDYVLQKR
ncbi:MAG: oligosaccharide flippase family protein [Hyphomicrobiales bacterium]